MIININCAIYNSRHPPNDSSSIMSKERNNFIMIFKMSHYGPFFYLLFSTLTCCTHRCKMVSYISLSPFFSMFLWICPKYTEMRLRFKLWMQNEGHAGRSPSFRGQLHRSNVSFIYATNSCCAHDNASHPHPMNHKGNLIIIVHEAGES